MNVNEVWKDTVYTDYTNISDPNNLLMHFANEKDAIASILRTSVAYSAPVTVLINAAALLMGNGTAINYSKYSGAKNLPMAERTWTQGFWANMVFSVLMTIIICGSCQALISLEQGQGLSNSLDTIKNSGNFSQEEIATITSFYTSFYEQTRLFASQYIYIMGGACVFALYSQFITYLVIAEGKQTMVILAAFLCNGINILLDFLLIKYGKLEMMGGGISTDIGWFLNTALCFSYVFYLYKRNDTNLNLIALKKINFIVKDYGFLVALGLPSFLRNSSMAVAATIQLSLIVAVATHTSEEQASTYQNIYGATNAIYNLSFTALFGIINGSRIICSYNYGARDFKRVRWSYLVNIVYALVYGTMMYFVVCYAANTWLLSLFDVSPTSGNNVFKTANYILQISMLQMPVMAIGIGGMTLFQATGRWWQASIAGVMQGVICCLPISFLMQWICIKYTNIDLFLWVPLVIAGVATIANLIWSIIYIKLHFQDTHAIDLIKMEQKNIHTNLASKNSK